MRLRPKSQNSASKDSSPGSKGSKPRAARWISEKHPLWLRITHWINVPALALMVWSGWMIYWANRVYTPFLTEGFYQKLHLHHRLAEGMSIHFTLAWIFVLNGLTFVTLTVITGHWRELTPTRATWPQLIPAILADLGLRKAPRSGDKFNPAQRVAYTGAIGLGTIETLSGFAIYKPVQLRPLTSLFGGYEGARLIHFAGMLALCLFTLVHVAQVLRAGWNIQRSIVAGFEEHVE